MNTKHIRNRIMLAKKHERETGQLKSFLLNTAFANLSSFLCRPISQTVKPCIDFIITYIDRVPYVLEATYSRIKNTNGDKQVYAILSFAEDLLVQVPQKNLRSSGLVELLDDAYIVHRLVEEVSDHYHAQYRINIAPMNTTTANVLVHQLIGEPFANELDAAVQFTIERTLRRSPDITVQ